MGLFNFNRQKAEVPTQKTEEKTEYKGEALSYQYAETPINIWQKVSSQGWVRFGENDKFYDNLLFLYDQSPMHRAILDRKIDMIVGGGYSINEDKYKILSTEKQVLVDKLLKYTDGRNDILEFLKSIIFDYLLTGQYSFLTSFTDGNTNIVSLKHKDITKIRVKPDCDDDEKIDSFLYCKNFNSSAELAKAKCYEPFDIFNKEHNLQMYYYANPCTSVEYYSLPSYFSAIKWIEVDTMIANLHKSNLINGFAPSVLMTFKENPTPEVKKNILKNIVGAFTNTNNVGKVAAFFVDDADLAPDITTFEPNSIHDRYNELNKTTDSKILTAHNVTSPELFGLMSPANLGNSDIDISYQIFKNTIINPLQSHFEKLVNNILKFNGVNIEFKLNEITLYSKADQAQQVTRPPKN
ncbi:portal_PBSX, phage portal protein, PBSX family [uncultured Caudovirales phage]|uniref:Portal_PBSX, phage portal protein, PBSX family n=1 Tax=uncultured Caudovirales phage TaxID=2100421 RepID=A0A6J7WDF6_9CAUD|nr:portal_PBSX, phage portal protein, PBSX family [uncultured Caudovirales phage]